MVTIREARPEDADAAIGIVRSSIEKLCVADHQNDPDTLARWLANKTPQSFRGWLSNPKSFCVVAEGERGLSGVGLLRHDGELVLFFLAPGTQRQGVGTLIYQALEKKAVQWGLSRLHLGSTFLARPFYEAQGFQSTGPAKTVFGVLLSYPYEKVLSAEGAIEL